MFWIKVKQLFSSFLYNSNKLNYLRQFPILRNFSTFELFLFSHLIQTRHFKKDEIIFQEQFPLAVIYLIQSGAIEIRSRYDLNEEPVILTKHQFIGVIDLYDENRRKEEAKAVKDTILLAISHIDFQKFINANPRTGVKLLSNICGALSHFIFQKHKPDMV